MNTQNPNSEMNPVQPDNPGLSPQSNISSMADPSSTHSSNNPPIPSSVSPFLQAISHVLGNDKRIVTAWLHGSAVCSSSPRDIDIAVLLSRETFAELQTASNLEISFAIPLELELERISGRSIDLQVVNSAPLPFQFSVVTKSVVLVDNNELVREEFELRTRVEYFDFRPRIVEYFENAA